MNALCGVDGPGEESLLVMVVALGCRGTNQGSLSEYHDVLFFRVSGSVCAIVCLLVCLCLFWWWFWLGEDQDLALSLGSGILIKSKCRSGRRRAQNALFHACAVDRCRRTIGKQTLRTIHFSPVPNVKRCDGDPGWHRREAWRRIRASDSQTLATCPIFLHCRRTARTE